MLLRWEKSIGLIGCIWPDASFVVAVNDDRCEGETVSPTNDRPKPAGRTVRTEALSMRRDFSLALNVRFLFRRTAR